MKMKECNKSLFMNIYNFFFLKDIHIYIYIYVCVCVLEHPNVKYLIHLIHQIPESPFYEMFQIS